MGKYKNLLVNVGIFGLSAVATKLMAFILMPLYTLYLSTEEYGIMDMATIMVTTLFPVLTLLISEGMLRFTLDDKSKSRVLYHRNHAGYVGKLCAFGNYSASI